MSEVKVILASGSPRRRQLLELIGIQHEVRPSNIDERIKGKETPHKHAERLAREKAGTVAKAEPDAIVIAADTIVVVNRKILGKPANAVDAGSMLSLLNGRNHTVITAVAVARGSKLKYNVEED